MKDYSSYAPRPAKYRAPSWSWAAVDGRIASGHVDSRLDPNLNDIWECDVLECNVSLANEALPFGRVVGATLKIRSPLKRMTWNPRAQSPQLIGLAARKEDDARHYQAGFSQIAVESLALVMPLRTASTRCFRGRGP